MSGTLFATDQADSYGQHGLYGHANQTIPSRLYDGLMNIPFIMRRPGTIAANQVSDLMIGQYDIMPTLLDMAGFGHVPIANTPGRSFAAHVAHRPLVDWPEEIYAGRLQLEAAVRRFSVTGHGTRTANRDRSRLPATPSIQNSRPCSAPMTMKFGSRKRSSSSSSPTNGTMQTAPSTPPASAK